MMKDRVAPEQNSECDVLIVGAGFSGIGACIQLKQAGIHNFRVLERASEVGGTWRDNTYPGCACDVPSHLYSFSFEPNPNWSRKYSGWREIEDYLIACVDKHGLRDHIEFNSALADAEFDQYTGRWKAKTEAGKTISARVLISAVGPLANAAYPNVDGIDDFEGESFHSATWNHDYDVAGKRIAAIGTGASAIQFVPQLAKTAAEVTLFQRTPPWVLPKPDRAFAEIEKTLFARFDKWRRFYRASIWSMQELTLVSFLNENSRLRTFAENLCKRHIAEHIKDPALQRTLTPSYELGCKRILLSNDYYPALAQPNVFVQTDPIAKISKDAVVTKSGVRHEVDAIVYGTGFQVTKPLHTVKLRGLSGKDLAESWEHNGYQNFLGTAVSDYPNFFMLAGPNTGIGHTSLIYMIESQLNHVMQGVKTVLKSRDTYLDVKAERQAAFMSELRSKMRTTVWSSGCDSWYLSETGENFTLWPDYTYKFRQLTRTLNLSDYNLVAAQSRPKLRSVKTGKSAA